MGSMHDSPGSADDASRSKSFRIQTCVVDGTLALATRRLAAARAGLIGLQIVTLPQLAARLAGGFVQPATPAQLETAARQALSVGGYSDIQGQAALPGMPRAVVRTLDRLWRAGVPLADNSKLHPRLADLALLETRIRKALGSGLLVVPDLVQRALARSHLFGTLTGEIRIERLVFVAPLWRPLLEALANAVSVRWSGCMPPAGWQVGQGEDVPAVQVRPVELVSCANPHAEAIEALRWARELIASGKATPEEIGIAAASPEPWDDSFLGLSNGARLPLHFSHGIPALCTLDGQACAALADLLAQGLSFGRVRRLLTHSANRCAALSALPPQALTMVPADAALSQVAQWRRALERAREARIDHADVAAVLMPVLELIAQGLEAATAAGEQLLPGSAAVLWRTALDRAPPEALPFTLSALRVPDGRDPGASIAWGPASQLAAAPRPWMRLIGMTSRAWPRPRREDPLLPDHILALDPASSPSRPELDRRLFATIEEAATEGLSLSLARRSPAGGAQSPSPLLPANLVPVRLARLRIPAHAYSEADRLLARPQEKLTDARLTRPIAASAARRSDALTPWDGPVRAEHPLILEALADIHSPSSLRLLLRDPQAFVWRYALGWRASLEETQPLELGDREFGQLVHEVLQRAVDLLEEGSGFASAADHEVEAALLEARSRISTDWPTRRPAPPALLWDHLLANAVNLALVALKLDQTLLSTRSWTEVPFGVPDAEGDLPWPAAARIEIPGTSFAIRGRIDRVEIAAADRAVRVTDYKTGLPPPRAANPVLAGGKELQRVLYSLAAKHHLPAAQLRADLVYLRAATPARLPLEDIEQAHAKVARLLVMADGLLRRGHCLPGPDAREKWSEYRLARPAERELKRKQRAIGIALGNFASVWEER